MVNILDFIGEQLGKIVKKITNGEIIVNKSLNTDQWSGSKKYISSLTPEEYFKLPNITTPNVGDIYIKIQE